MRILVISDIHANLEALRAIIEKETYDSVWFLGDLADYGPDPDLVLDTLRDLKPEVWISGNHDYANAFGVDCKCGEKTHDLSVYTRENISQKKLSKEDIQFLRNIPLKKEMQIEGKNYYFVHGCPADPLYGYMFDFMPECMRNEIGGEIHTDYLFFGHTHFPVMGEYKSLRYLNPGSVGQPRDGDPRASYAIVEDGKFELRRTEYPVEKTIAKIRNSVENENYRERLIEILKNGKV
jgi:putative phosphoesterase